MMPVAYYLFWWAYASVGPDMVWVFDVIKMLSCALSVIFIYRFALDYLPRNRALLAALLLIFNPVHEVTLYWYMTLPYVLTPAIIMLSHHYVRHEKYNKGFLIGCLGSFMYYISPPYSIGLAVIFILEKSYKKALIFILPGLLYISYYFSISIIKPLSEHRISHEASIADVIKTYFLEIPTYFDSFFGPSYWYKIYYSIAAIELLSFILALFFIIFMIKHIKIERCNISKSLLGGLIAVLLLSFGIFALSDILGFRAFNLGNRLSVYGSLLIAFFVASIPLSRTFIMFIAIFFVLPTFGLSDHWKSWNLTQLELIKRVENNQGLRNLTESDTLLISGNMYSQLGPFAHIDFFSMPWNVDAIFTNVTNCKQIIPLNTYIHIEKNYLIDDKSGLRITIDKNLYLYKSTEDKLIKISPDLLPKILATRPKYVRHWIQLFNRSWIAINIANLNPRFAALVQ